MLKPLLACCKLYISESRNAAALELIEKAAKLHPETIVVNKFKDEAYNRVGYTIVSQYAAKSSPSSVPLKEVVFNMVKAAFEAINLEVHSGTHPRLGVVDHICFHPLTQCSLDQVAGLAKAVASDVGHKLQVPTYLYGAAHNDRQTLDSIRRKLGYFSPNSVGKQWSGGLTSDFLALKPDEGPLQLDNSKGVVVIGATKWVDNYNVPIYSTDIQAVSRIARKVSARGGGLMTVQAMGLVHGEDSAEVACNLLDPCNVGADQVQKEVRRLALEEGLTVDEGYFTDFSQEKIIEMYLKSVSCNSIDNQL